MDATIYIGDMREKLAAIADESIDAIVTDPPYHLTTGKKGGSGLASVNPDSPAGRSMIGTGFMGMKWDGGDIALRPETWALLLRVAKPGAHLVVFGGTRTFHRVWCAVEDAGWEIRDTIMYMYGTGFPKSHNLDRKRGDAICGCSESDDQMRGVRPAKNDAGRVAEASQDADLFSEMQRETALRGADIARLPADRTERTEPEAEGSEQSSMEGRRDVSPEARQLREREVREIPEVGATDGPEGRLRDGASPRDGGMVRPSADENRDGPSRRPRSAAQRTDESRAMAGQSEPQTRGAWPLCPRCGKPDLPRGLGSALKPAYEPILIARKPLRGTLLENELRHGVGALNIDGCRIDVADRESYAANHSGDRGHAGTTDMRPGGGSSSVLGRWPANVLHDGSEEVVAAFPQSESGSLTPSHRDSGKAAGVLGEFKGREITQFFGGDSGSAARFFWCPKASRKDRNEGLESPGTFQSEGTEREQQNYHPTVKPTELMQYLCKLVAPRGARILDPFMGSGSTGKAAVLEGMDFIGFELDADYTEIARRRIVSRDPLFTRANVSQ